MPRLRLSDKEAEIIEAYRKNEGIEVANITSDNNYTKPRIGFTAIGDNGLLMNIEDYCTHYGLDHTKIRSYKLISHTAIPFYNIVFYNHVVFILNINYKYKNFSNIKKIYIEI